jgi:sugar phosphate isomerase/epimerase
MRLGINTYTYMWSIGFEGARPENPMTAVGLLEQARRLGVKVVQVGPNLPLDKLTGPELDTFCDRAREWEIELELGTRGLEFDHLAAQVALCKRIGATLLRTIPEIGGRMPSTPEITASLRAILPVLEREGVRLGMENGKIPAADLAQVVEETASPLCGIVLDTVNSLAVPEGWKQVAETLAPYTMCLHLKEFIVKRVWHMMGFLCEGRAAGQGQLDIPWLLEACRKSRYDYNVIIELWPPEQKTLGETIALEEAWAVESVKFLRRHIPD